MNFRRMTVLALGWMWLAVPSSGLYAQHHHDQHGSAQAADGKTGHKSTGATGAPLATHSIVQEGVAVTLTLARPSEGGTAEIREGDDVAVRIALTDTATGAPLTGLFPVGWVDHRESAAPTGRAVCHDKIQSYLRGTLQIRPAIDLNSSYVLTLTAGNTVAVYDPIVGFNISKLYAAAPLKSVGDDWALAPDERRLFVSMPLVNEIAVVNTSIWRVETNVTVGLRPTRLSFQPDGRYLWVVNGGPGGAASGVSVVDPETLDVVKHIATGTGPHELTFSPDSRFAFVTNGGSGSLSIIDVAQLAEVKEIATSPLPVGVAYSTVGEAVFVSHESDGAVVVVDAGNQEVIERLVTRPGVRSIHFDPSGRWGFAVNPKEDEVYILDASIGTVTDTLQFGQAPDQVAFTPGFAYVRSSGTPDVAMIPLETLAEDGRAKVMPFEAGRMAPTKFGSSSTAAAIAPASHHMMDAVYVPNAAEKSIYLYHYMMSMPMPAGRVDTYPFEPTAALVMSRALSETEPGVYTTTFKAPTSGEWDVVFLLDEPRVLNCFDFDVSENPEMKTTKRPRIQIQPLDGEEKLPIEEAAEYRFKLVNEDTGEAQSGLEDVWVWVFSSRGWSTRTVAEHVEDGVYKIELTLPMSGMYQMIVASQTLNVRFEDTFPVVLRAAKE